MLHVEALDALALLESAIQFHQLRAADRFWTSASFAEAVVSRGYVPRAFRLNILVLDEIAEFCGRRVDGAEAEHVEDENAVVVQQVRDRLADELVVGVCQQRDLPYAVDPVDVG